MQDVNFYISFNLISTLFQLPDKSMQTRHSGMDCRNPECMDSSKSPSMLLDTRFPAGMTKYYALVEATL